MRAGEAVTIYRDTFGVPHVFAETVGALYFGFGYAMAEDRLFQIEHLKRAASGRMAEMIGPAALAADKGVRTILDSDESYLDNLRSQDSETQLIYEAYVDGVNQYIAEAKENPDAKLPKEFPALGIELTPLTVVESLKISTLLSRKFGFYGGRELENLAFYNELTSRYGDEDGRRIFDDVLPQNDPDAYTSVPASESANRPSAAALSRSVDTWPVQSLDVSRAAARQIRKREEIRKILEDFVSPASCGWAISPGRSATGNVMMGISTADGAEAHLHGAGIDASGYTFPGVPALGGSGRTRNFVWQFTVGYADQIDTYIETLHPDDRYRYRHQGEWKKMERRTETIGVRNGEPVQFEVDRTVHGPVIEWDLAHDRAYSIKYAGSDLEGGELREASGLLEIYRASNFREFARAIESLILNVNVLYGDNEGNIAYWHAGRHPIRPKGADSRLPVPGTGKYEWLGYIPHHELPHSRNPDQGYLVSWNNKPRSDWEAGDFGRWGKTHRVYKPVDLIEADPSITWEDGIRFHEEISRSWGHIGGNINYDITKPDFFKQHIRDAASTSTDARVRQAAAHVEQWNGLHKDVSGDGYYDSVGLTIFRKWFPMAVRNIFADEIGDERTYLRYAYHLSLLLRALEEQDAGLPLSWDFLNGGDRNAVINRTMVGVIEELTAEYATPDMSRWKHPVFRRSFEKTMPGLATTLGFVKDIPENGASSYTHLVELSKPAVRMVSAIPTGGQSWFISLDGIPSPHLTDQLQLHAAYEYKPMHLELDDILANLESKTVLTAQKYPAP